MNTEHLKPIFKKHTRLRKRKMRRWTAEEESKILDYLLETRDIAERKGSREYYQDLVDRYKWTMDYNLVRNKVTNMKDAYLKQLAWKQNAIASGKFDSSVINERMLKRCPNEKKLAILMMHDEEMKKRAIADYSDTSATASIPIQSIKEEIIEEDFDMPDLSWVVNSNITIPNHRECSDPLQELDDHQNSQEKSEIRKEQMSLEWMKLEIEKEKLLLQREKLQADHNYRVLQLEQQERLRKLQIEKDAEVELKKFEMSLKYKVSSKSEM